MCVDTTICGISMYQSLIETKPDFLLKLSQPICENNCLAIRITDFSVAQNVFYSRSISDREYNTLVKNDGNEKWKQAMCLKLAMV